MIRKKAVVIVHKTTNDLVGINMQPVVGMPLLVYRDKRSVPKELITETTKIVPCIIEYEG